jgi:hypothetical protein
MRLLVVLSVMCLASCASEKLTQGPPSGVDFSGMWKLNAADSDDAERLISAQFNTPAPGTTDQSSPPSGGQGRGQGGGRGGRGQDGIGGLNPSAGPILPSVSVLNEGLRWPGKQLEIKQVAAVVAFTSDNVNRICQPGGRAHKHHAGDDRDGDSSGRDPPSRRDPPPPRCSWEDKTLIVRGGDPDDDHPPFEERYSLSDDGQRLVEVVTFRGGRSSGFTMSRVWDRVK